MVVSDYNNTGANEKRWFVNYDQREYVRREEINTNSKGFFKSTYSGLVASINRNQKEINWLNSGIEISYYPDFANIINQYSGVKFDTNVSQSMLMASLKLGLKTKKAVQK